MHSFRESSKTTKPDPTIKLSFPVDAVLVAGTLPLLAFVVSSRFIEESLIELGKASEEIFRGDRLPSQPLMQRNDKES